MIARKIHAVLAVTSMFVAIGCESIPSRSYVDTGGKTPFQVSGTVSGLSGKGLVLVDDIGDSLPVAADGPFTFPTTYPAGAQFNVAVAADPSGQTCTVSGGSGEQDAASNVAVSCAAK